MGSVILVGFFIKPGKSNHAALPLSAPRESTVKISFLIPFHVYKLHFNNLLFPYFFLNSSGSYERWQDNGTLLRGRIPRFMDSVAPPPDHTACFHNTRSFSILSEGPHAP